MTERFQELTLHQLRIFRAVAERQSFARAAADLGLTPASVSAQIRKLAAIVGLDLVELLGRKVRLTDAGRLLEAHAASMEAQVRELAQQVEAQRSGETGTVRVGASTTAGTYLLPPLLAAFKAGHPRIAVALRIGNSADVERWLLEAEVDLGFSGFSRIAPDLETQAIIDDEIVFACAPGHPLAKERGVPLERLVTEPCLVREPGSATRRVVEERLYERSLELQHPMELASLEVIKQGVMAGLGISWFSALSVARELRAGDLVRVDVQGLSLSRTFYLVRHRRKLVTPALATFLAFAETWQFPGRAARR